MREACAEGLRGGLRLDDMELRGVIQIKDGQLVRKGNAILIPYIRCAIAFLLLTSHQIQCVVVDGNFGRFGKSFISPYLLLFPPKCLSSSNPANNTIVGILCLDLSHMIIILKGKKACFYQRTQRIARVHLKIFYNNLIMIRSLSDS